jgi:hypothetical protein
MITITRHAKNCFEVSGEHCVDVKRNRWEDFSMFYRTKAEAAVQAARFEKINADSIHDHAWIAEARIARVRDYLAGRAIRAVNAQLDFGF